MGIGDLLNDREPEPAALGFGAGQAKEAIEYARAFGGRDAGPAVLDDDGGGAALLEEREAYLTSRRGIADGVVDEVAHQRVQALRLTLDGRALQPREAHLHAARLGLRLELGGHFGDELVELDRNGLRIGLRLEARHGEHLLDQARRAP